MKKIILALLVFAAPAYAGDYCIGFDAQTREGIWILEVDCSVFVGAKGLLTVSKTPESLREISARLFGLMDVVTSMILDVDGKTIHIPVNETTTTKVIRDIP